MGKESSFEESCWVMSLSLKILPSMTVKGNCFHVPCLNEGKTQLHSHYLFNSPINGEGKAEACESTLANNTL